MQRPRFADRGPTPSQVICLVAELTPTRTRAADVGEIYKLPAQLTLRGRTQDEDTFTFNALSSLAHTLLSPIAFSILAKSINSTGDSHVENSITESQYAATHPTSRPCDCASLHFAFGQCRPPGKWWFRDWRLFSLAYRRPCERRGIRRLPGSSPNRRQSPGHAHHAVRKRRSNGRVGGTTRRNDQKLDAFRRLGWLHFRWMRTDRWLRDDSGVFGIGISVDKL